MLERILIPLDGSRRSEAVLRQLGTLIRSPGTEVLVVRATYVHPTVRGVDPTSHLTDCQEEAKSYVSGFVRSLRSAGVQARGIIPTGFAAGCILDTARTEKASLIAMSSHGSSGYARWALGNVAEKVLAASPIPVLLVRSFHAGTGGSFLPVPEEELRFRKILVPTDGSEESLSVIPAARELARATGAEILVLHVAESHARSAVTKEIAEVVSDRLRMMGASASAVSALGDPASQIIDHGLSRRIDLIAMATQGSPEGSPWPLGSVTRKVMRALRLPMLVVRSGSGGSAGDWAWKGSLSHPLALPVPDDSGDPGLPN
ncbi:MAG TPA: universal stress protein [Planctomycetota bacterium]|nr:universal stress protein [Planctomycetota bacterium]